MSNFASEKLLKLQSVDIIRAGATGALTWYYTGNNLKTAGLVAGSGLLAKNLTSSFYEGAENMKLFGTNISVDNIASALACMGTLHYFSNVGMGIKVFVGVASLMSDLMLEENQSSS